ncbi:MAG: M56 family metallopeptidase [Armatimonadetes bacterium]|nr:M56 family metallopeptidase [Armatimonadota bacterium]
MEADLLTILLLAPTPVLVVSWWAGRAGRGWAPSLRSAVWRMALLGCWLAAALALAARLAGWSLPFAVAPSALRLAVRWCAWPLMALWLAGMAVGLARLVGDALAVRRLLRTTSLLDDPEAWDFVARCGDRIGLPALPFVARSAEVPVPLLAGWRGARLVLPERFMPAAAEQHAALAHELAHVRRGDPWAQLLSRLTRVVWWWHPLVHVVGRELESSAEEACDDWAVAVTGERRALARMLVDLAAGASALALSLAGPRAGLARRVERLLEETEMPSVTMSWRTRCCAALSVAAVALLGAALGAWAATPEYLVQDAVGAKGVKVDTTTDVEDAYAWAIGQVCAEAAGVYHKALGLPEPETVNVKISRTETWFASVVTDRDSTVYASYNDDGRLGDRLRGRPRPVGILCQAVGELFNRHRVPGLGRYVAYLLAVPRISEALGDQAWPKPYDYRTIDGPATFHPRSVDQRFLAEHPDWAAASALYFAADALGNDWLGEQLRGLDGDGAEALAAIRKAAVAARPALNARFAAWDTATRDRREADGSLLLTSFETDEQCDRLPDRGSVQFATTEEWATHGERSAVVTYQQTGSFAYLRALDEDWLYHDFSGYRTLELDARNVGDKPVRLWVSTNDAPDWGHGWLYGWCDLKPGETKHYMLHLVKQEQVAGQTDTRRGTAVYFEGQSRLAETATLSLFVAPDDNLPATVWIDNLRLRP